MRFRFAVNFESESKPVQVIRGDLIREGPDDACKSAVYLAFKQAPKGVYRSWCVVVERVDAADEVQVEDVRLDLLEG